MRKAVAVALTALALLVIQPMHVSAAGRPGCVFTDNRTNDTLTITVTGFEAWSIPPVSKGFLHDVNGGGTPGEGLIVIYDDETGPRFASQPGEHLSWHYYTRADLDSVNAGHPSCPGVWYATFTPGTGTVTEN